MIHRISVYATTANSVNNDCMQAHTHRMRSVTPRTNYNRTLLGVKWKLVNGNHTTCKEEIGRTSLDAAIMTQLDRNAGISCHEGVHLVFCVLNTGKEIEIVV